MYRRSAISLRGASLLPQHSAFASSLELLPCLLCSAQQSCLGFGQRLHCASTPTHATVVWAALPHSPCPSPFGLVPLGYKGTRVRGPLAADISHCNWQLFVARWLQYLSLWNGLEFDSGSWSPGVSNTNRSHALRPILSLLFRMRCQVLFCGGALGS